MIVSASYLCRTRLCRARNCPDDSEPYALLCARHERLKQRGHPVELHVTPEAGEPTLWCSTCRRDKPDHEFGIRPDANSAGRPSNRRGRFWCCLKCEAGRKRTRRSNLTPQERDEIRARDRARKARARRRT